MTARRHRFGRRLSLHWLLWLALMLPLGQTAAAWHALSHVSAAASRDDGQQAAHAAHCDLCLAASAVAGGALVAQALGLPPSPAHEARPSLRTAGRRQTPVALAYRSRAPPVSPH